MSKQEILQKAQAGDPDSIEEICSATWEPVYRYIYARVQNRQEAEDITQETYVKALSWTKKKRIHPKVWLSFLKRVALNIVRDRWRQNQRRGVNTCIDDINPEQSAVSDETDEYALRELIETALDNISKEQRTVIELRILQGYSVKDTAKVMKLKEGTVRVMQYRALHNLAEILNHYNLFRGE